MEKNLTLSKPVIPSQNSANIAVAEWLAANEYHHIKDATGQQWRLVLRADERPDKGDHRRTEYRLVLTLETSVDAISLVRTGVLAPVEDSRLLALLGDAVVPIQRRPVQSVVSSLEAARIWVSENIQRLRRDMATETFSETKRHLISRYVNESRGFGGRPTPRYSLVD